MLEAKNTFSERAFRKSVGLDENSTKPIVCVQGLGFVGAAMAVAVAKSVNEHNEHYFDVVGLDKSNAVGLTRISSINNGKFPFSSSDQDLDYYTKKCRERKNFCATTDISVIKHAKVVVVDVNLDVNFSSAVPTTNFESLRDAIRSIGQNIRPNALVMVETTVPPGTCERIILPILRECFDDRGLNPQDVILAHSYERVMPGPDYLNSITDYWRVYAGINDVSSDKCLDFLKKIVNTDSYPPRRVSSISASETAKVLENTFRAVNIALIDEWSDYAEGIGVDLFEVIDAIRDRPTHKNIRQPGFGVGGYCLTKDPLFSGISQRNFFPEINSKFPFANLAIETNYRMPIRNLDRILNLVSKPRENVAMLMLGVAYKADIDDTRYSAAEIFYNEAQARGLHVSVHDPKVRFWSEVGVEIQSDLPNVQGIDVIVLCVAHREYRSMDIVSWIGSERPIVYDCDRVLNDGAFQALSAAGVRVYSVGRGR